MIWVLRFVPFTACACFLFAYIGAGKDVTAENIVDFTPDNRLFAAIILLFLYAFKSITVFFPASALSIAGGLLFIPQHAILINSIGVLIELCIPYWLGRMTGKNFIQEKIDRHLKLSEFIKKKSENFIFKSAIVRFVYVIPRDKISRYFGIMKMPFGAYLLGSFVGIFPSMAVTTLLGSSLTDPLSANFWIFLIATVAIAAISILLYLNWSKDHHKRPISNQNEGEV